MTTKPIHVAFHNSAGPLKEPGLGTLYPLAPLSTALVWGSKGKKRFRFLTFDSLYLRLLCCRNRRKNIKLTATINLSRDGYSNSTGNFVPTITRNYLLWDLEVLDILSFEFASDQQFFPPPRDASGR